MLVIFNWLLQYPKGVNHSTENSPYCHIKWSLTFDEFSCNLLEFLRMNIQKKQFIQFLMNSSILNDLKRFWIYFNGPLCSSSLNISEAVHFYIRNLPVSILMWPTLLIRNVVKSSTTFLVPINTQNVIDKQSVQSFRIPPFIRQQLTYVQV